MVKRLTFEDVKKRFDDQGRTDIEICKDEFTGWKKKSKFFDKIQREYFWSVPYRVWKDKVVHPKRVTEKRKKTLLKRYGVKHQSQLQEVKDKISKTHLENFADPKKAKEIKHNRRQGCLNKFGVDNAAKSKKVREKIIKTNLERYGGHAPASSSKIRVMARQTNLAKYGVDNPMKSPEIKAKLKATNRQKYDVDFIGASKVVREKIQQTLLTKYGSTNSFLVGQDNVRIEETNEYITHWLDRQPGPKPSLSTICRYFYSWDSISVADVEKFVENYSENKTSLEILAEQLFTESHYNKEVTPRRYKPDFKLSPQIFLNVDGLYWHSEAQKKKQYHFKLREEFEKAGLRIFQFREDEIRDKPDIVKSVVWNALGKSQNRIFARKCKVRLVKHNEARNFLEQNHLMGSTKAKHLGLFHDNELVSLLSWKCRKNICKIERFCSTLNTNVVGGFSKLLAHLEKTCLRTEIVEIHNWIDLRYGTGKHLEAKKFQLTKETLGWKWTDYKSTFNRLKCRANMDERKMSQKEHAKELGWAKIYDAGQRLYVKKIDLTKRTL